MQGLLETPQFEEWQRREGDAQWEIFQLCDVAALRAWLSEQDCNLRYRRTWLQGSTDPIHDQCHFITQHDLQALYTDTGNQRSVNPKP